MRAHAVFEKVLLHILDVGDRSQVHEGLNFIVVIAIVDTPSLEVLDFKTTLVCEMKQTERNCTKMKSPE